MTKEMENNNSNGWLWVIVNVKETDGHYLGLYDEQRDVDFIPAFASKEKTLPTIVSLIFPGKRGNNMRSRPFILMS